MTFPAPSNKGNTISDCEVESQAVKVSVSCGADFTKMRHTNMSWIRVYILHNNGLARHERICANTLSFHRVDGLTSWSPGKGAKLKLLACTKEIEPFDLNQLVRAGRRKNERRTAPVHDWFAVM